MRRFPVKYSRRSVSESCPSVDGIFPRIALLLKSRYAVVRPTSATCGRLRECYCDREKEFSNASMPGNVPRLVKFPISGGSVMDSFALRMRSPTEESHV